MNKFFLILGMLVSWVHGYAQDINCNSFDSFNNKTDTSQISWGARYGQMQLVEPAPFFKSTRNDFPEKVGVGNFILDFRTRFARDTVSGTGHDAMTGMNLSLLRSRVYIGYQYNRPEWFISGRVGYQVYRVDDGEVRAHTKTFTNKIPLVGVEFGVNPDLWNQMFRARVLLEYDFGFFGYFGSGVFTTRIFDSKLGKLDVGVQYDGIWGYGGFTSFQTNTIMFYVSQFAQQLPFQESRFPEQRFGMEKGFAFGVQVNFK